MVDAETQLLRDHGDDVDTVMFDNTEFAAHGSGPRVALGAIWNARAGRRVADAVRRYRPDVVHVHNTFPAASPLVFRTASVAPIVHTVHNFRWSCLAATFHRDGGPCEDCLGRLPWPGVVHACYHGDRAASSVVALMLGVHRTLGTFRHVDRFVALSEFARGKLAAAGVDPERIVVKPNFMEPGPPPPPVSQRADPGYALFVGRLTEEKGVRILADAWRDDPSLPPLVVAGDGPLREEMQRVPGVQCLGEVTRDEVQRRMREARMLLFPSTWYEGFPMVLLEAFASGLPVVASDLGVMGDLVVPGRTGWRASQGDAADWARTVRRAWSDPGWPELSDAVRRIAVRQYGPDAAYARLAEVYAETVRAHEQRGRAGVASRVNG